MGRQSSKKKAGKVTHTEPGRHSCSSLYGTPPLPTQRSSRSSNVTHEHIYVHQFPPILHPYIGSVQDVIPDGNCGFRTIAVCLGFGEHAWDTVRRDLIGELSAFWHEYVAMFGSEEHALGVHNSLNFFELDRAAPVQHWMTMPNMGLLIASRYNVILHVLSFAQSFTYLPLRSTPPPQYQHVAIAIGHVNNNHYVQVSLAGGYPMPTIMPQWNYFRYECAAAWVLPYMEQLDVYMQHTRSRFPPETIVVEN
ncbi:uncharacterized protein LOC120004931 [Tripterygium wilfordii]|uniref:uncharacterized protein LOC120004931 n=1 Tax=Tripterygium wilfordii TaxID=458696 RepID=UPI0018F81A8F|nr:uncharacterized protein LOC120004931 [Tripterygium wilfordii]